MLIGSSLVLEDILKFMKEMEQIAGCGAMLKIEDNWIFVTINLSELDAATGKERLLKLIERISPNIIQSRPLTTVRSRGEIPDENIDKKENSAPINCILIHDGGLIEIKLGYV